MEEIIKFLRLLYKYRIILITVPIITVVCTFLLVRNLPNVYSSQALISTGLVDETKQSIISDLNILQESKVVQKFSTLVDMIKLKSTLDQVSYQLILHDLQYPDSAFRTESNTLKELNKDARKHAVEVYTEMYNRRKGLDLYNTDQRGLYVVLQSMGYDEESLKGGLTVERQGTSDYISITHNSENPELSAYIANTLSKEFIHYYNEIKKENNKGQIIFLQATLQEKQDTLDRIEKEFNDYQIKNRVINLEEQAASIYTLKNEYDSRARQTETQIASDRAAIADIDRKFSPQARGTIQNIVNETSVELAALSAERSALEEKYIDANFDPSLNPQRDSLKAIQTQMNKRAIQERIVSPVASDQALIERKSNLQTDLALALGSLASINAHLAEKDAEYERLIPHQAVVQRFARKLEIAGQEYLAAKEKLSIVGLDAVSATQLSLAQKGLPGLAEKSKKPLLIILSFIVSVVFCLMVFFVIFFFDTSIKQSSELAEKTGVPVLGHLNILSDSVLDLKKMWNAPDTRDRRLFKDMLRSVRFETEREMGTDKILLINSLCRGEGKTVFALSLTYAFAMTGKRVLLVDGNFKDNGISKTLKVQNFLEDFLVENNLSILTESGSINVLGNRGGDTSLLEISSEETIRRKMKDLETHFDLVIIESAALKALNVSSEWALFADKIICVFEAGRRMSPNRKGNINYLMNLDEKFIGWVLNKIPGRYLAPLVDKTWLTRKK